MPTTRILLSCACVLFAAGALVAQPDFPKPTGRVSDFAGVLDASSQAEIDRLLDDLERTTSSEVAVAVVRSLDGMSVEEYASRLFKAWGIGQAKQDNGVLVLVAPNERDIRIEVGYGLEGVLPDGLAAPAPERLTLAVWVGRSRPSQSGRSAVGAPWRLPRGSKPTSTACCARNPGWPTSA